MKLPEYKERYLCETALEKFVHENEPAGIEDEQNFRDGLSDVCDEIYLKAIEDLKIFILQKGLNNFSRMDIEVLADKFKQAYEKEVRA
jgi:hypothetical protein